MKDFVDRLANFVAYSAGAAESTVPIFGAEALRLYLRDPRDKFCDEAATLTMADLTMSHVYGFLLTPAEQKAAEALSTALLRKGAAPVEKKKAREPAEKKPKHTQAADTEDTDTALARLFV